MFNGFVPEDLERKRNLEELDANHVGNNKASYENAAKNDMIIESRVRW